MFGVGVLQRLSARVMPGLARRTISTEAPPAQRSAAEEAKMSRKLFARSLGVQIDNMQSTMLGRSVPVTGWGVARAYGRLNFILTENGIRKELFRRRYYEKPKYKRQRLLREGHIRRFKDEVRKKVHLVYRMKTLGI
ncbi:hypothetical protein H4R19_005465 [Coemansia spiralis]|nr:hypothetical protein H4R19_005465 [Coemansia spiralis]